MDYKKSAVSGFKWSSSSKIIRQGSSFLTLIVLAQILDPSDFGLVGMALVVIEFLNVFRDLGISAALIQKDKVTIDLFSSVFWLNLFFAILIIVTIFLLAPLIGDLYNEQRVTGILRVLSIGFLFTGMTVLQQAMFEKELNFKFISIIEMLSTILASVVGISIAFYGGGVWSLVYQSLTGILVFSVFLWFQSPWKPKFSIHLTEIKTVMKFSINLSGFNISNYFVRNADYFLIGKYLGATELGYYTLAYKIMLYPLQNLTSIVNRVIFPLFSKYKNNIELFRAQYITIVNLIAIVTFPLIIFVIVLNQDIILGLLGKRWEPVITLIFILAPLGLVQSVYTTAGVLYQVTSNTDIWFKWGVFTSILFISAFVIGLKWGVVGVAIAYLIVNIIVMYPGLKIPFNFISLKPKDFILSFKYTFMLSSLTGLLIFLLKVVIMNELNHISTIIVVSVIGVPFYIFLLHKFNSQILIKIKMNLFNR